MTQPTNPHPREVLGPCPKCESEETGVDQYSHKMNRWAVECFVCCYASQTYDTREEAIAAWNTREAAEASAQPGEREAKMLQHCSLTIRNLERKGDLEGLPAIVAVAHVLEDILALRAPRADIVEKETSGVLLLDQHGNIR